jgi:hypothetical protein
LELVLAAAVAVAMQSNTAEKILNWAGYVKPQDQIHQRISALESQCAEHTARLRELAGGTHDSNLVHTVEESPGDVSQ